MFCHWLSVDKAHLEKSQIVCVCGCVCERERERERERVVPIPRPVSENASDKSENADTGFSKYNEIY